MAQWEGKFNSVVAKQQGEAAKDYGEEMGKIMTVARRLMHGDQVPMQDEKKLMEYDKDLYIMAKNAGMMARLEKRKKYDSLWEDDVLGILQVVQNGLGRASVLGNGGFLRGHLAVDDSHVLGVVNGGIVGGQDFHVIGTALVVSAGVDVGDDIRRGFRGGAGQIVIEDVQNFHCHLGILAVLADHQEPVGGVFVVGVDDSKHVTERSRLT